MAEDKSGAKNEMGKLFVDIGIGGLGKALKSLNSVSASFLLGKNAAMQFAQTISQPFKEAGKGAIEIGKMSNALATTGIEFQKLSLYLKNHGLSDALLGDVSKLQQIFYDLSQGFSNLDGSMAVGLAQAGLDPKKYKGTFEDTMRMLDDLQKATANMSLEKRNQILRQIGISSDWGYLWDKGGRAGDYLTISDEEIQKLQSMQEAIESAKNSLETLMTKYLAKMSPAIEDVANWLTGRTRYATPEKVRDRQDIITGKNMSAINTGDATADYTMALARNIVHFIKTGELPDNKYNRKRGITRNPSGGAASIFSPDIEENAALPPNLSGLSQNITNNISHDITINGDNAQAIANKIAGLSEQDIQYSQYQANNMAGI